jgi:Response regulator containing CheY-like receiver, AAA-type ATPase, and DNA-binding domains
MMKTMVNNESFLVLDDDLGTRTIMSEMVSALGFHCTAAKNKHEALSLLEHQNFDMVIADIENIEGLNLISEVRQTMKDVPFVVITGYSNEFTYDKVVAAGANDFIKKPFTHTELKNKLNRILQERRLAFDNECLLSELITTNKKISNRTKKYPTSWKSRLI